MRMNKNALAIAVALVATGCSSTTDVQRTAPLNQPDMGELVVLNSNEPIAPAIDTTKPVSGNTVNVLASNTTTTEAIEQSDTLLPVIEEVKSTKLELREVYTAVSSDTVNNYMLIRGETYRSAIYRWLHKEGYTKVGELLDDADRALLETEIASDRMLTTTFDEALAHIHSEILDAMEPGDKTNFQIHFEPEVKQAVLSSSILPTTMFLVTKGTLRDNYLSLGEHYQWNVDERFYLATNYEVPFSYVIVTEKYNVKAAIEQLLAPYEDLRAGIVPSGREIYIMGDKDAK